MHKPGDIVRWIMTDPSYYPALLGEPCLIVSIDGCGDVLLIMNGKLVSDNISEHVLNGWVLENVVS